MKHLLILALIIFAVWQIVGLIKDIRAKKQEKENLTKGETNND